MISSQSIARWRAHWEWSLHTPCRAKVNRNRPLVGLLVACALALGLNSLPAVDRVSLPGAGRRLSRNSESGVVAVGLMLRGVAFLHVEGASLGEPLIMNDWPTLDAIPVGAERFLLADRFGNLRLVEVAANGPLPPEARQLALWPVEGVPTGLFRAGDLMYVASASAGLSTYRWDGSDTAPVLVSRYPFVDYSKQIVVRTDGLGLLADNLETGLQILDLRTPAAPAHITSIRAGFVESVAYAGDTIAMVDRRSTTRLLNISNPAKPLLLMDIKPLADNDGRGPDIRQAIFSHGSDLLICESTGGAHLYRLGTQEGRPSAQQIYRFDEVGALDGLFLEEQRLLLSLSSGELRLVSLPQ